MGGGRINTDTCITVQWTLYPSRIVTPWTWQACSMVLIPFINVGQSWWVLNCSLGTILWILPFCQFLFEVKHTCKFLRNYDEKKWHIFQSLDCFKFHKEGVILCSEHFITDFLLSWILSPHYSHLTFCWLPFYISYYEILLGPFLDHVLKTPTKIITVKCLPSPRLIAHLQDTLFKLQINCTNIYHDRDFLQVW